MWPQPDDPVLVRRMRAAHALACATLRVRPVRGEHQIWGWHGRTLGQAVISRHGPRWLRLHSVPANQIIETFWNGAIDAQRSIPSSVPRPRLLAYHDWADQQWAYRAELYQSVSVRPVARHAVLTTDPHLPSAWWFALRSALDDIAVVPTDRVTLHEGFLAWAMPHYLGTHIHDHASDSWTTAHGDLHYANLCGPHLSILDWEGWGVAPDGYDAAMLHSYSLLVPTVAARVRDQFAGLFGTSTGRFAELAVITELLHTTTYGDNLELAAPLRQRAALLLGRTVPVVHRRPEGY